MTSIDGSCMGALGDRVMKETDAIPCSHRAQALLPRSLMFGGGKAKTQNFHKNTRQHAPQVRCEVA